MRSGCSERFGPRLGSPRYLPEGLYAASEAEVTFRFGISSSRRRRLALRLRRWIELVRQVGGRRLLVDGSFVTAKQAPNDIDAVVLLPRDFQAQVEQGSESALELERMLLSRHPEEILAADDDADWNDWVDFSVAHVKPTEGERVLWRSSYDRQRHGIRKSAGRDPLP